MTTRIIQSGSVAVDPFHRYVAHEDKVKHVRDVQQHEGEARVIATECFGTLSRTAVVVKQKGRTLLLEGSHDDIVVGLVGVFTEVKRGDEIFHREHVLGALNTLQPAMLWDVEDLTQIVPEG